MMSSLLFYHKKENPLTLAIENEGHGGFKRFCSELVSTVRKTTTSETREPKEGEMTRHCAISVDVAGVEPAIPGLQNLGRPTFGCTPYDSFLAGESDPGVGRRTPFASSRLAGFGVAQTSTVITLHQFNLPHAWQAHEFPRGTELMLFFWEQCLHCTQIGFVQPDALDEPS